MSSNCSDLVRYMLLVPFTNVSINSASSQAVLFNPHPAKSWCPTTGGKRSLQPRDLAINAARHAPTT
eukprot:6166704-Pyramimonas_sp.AAC.2